MTSTRDRIPAHLRRHVVEQDYGAYDEIDHAVWRFVLLQTYARLCETAHPAYVEGLRQTGIRVDRIPEIPEMDRCLAEYGWGAVAVDGFIPPRAFQEFQALGILTIAVNIRRPEHLAYTAAPDIIHESAGHAPIVPDSPYRDYLRRFGEIGARAFSLPEDRTVYDAGHALSELKEEPDATAAQLAAAQGALAEAESAVGSASEATLLSRLHWWTVEYGLVGTPEDYKIYGAGLLSSLGESHFCHAPSVRKLPLSVTCVETDYDITRPQPQLFVTADFAQLSEVLEQVADTLAQRRGGALALERAQASAELATVELDSGLQISGVPGGADPGFLRFAGPCALAYRGRTLDGHDPARHSEGYSTPLGPLADGRPLCALADAELSGRVEHRYASGIEVAGRATGSLRAPDGALLLVTLGDCTVRRGDELLYRPEWGPFDLAAGATVEAAFAGPADPGYYDATPFPELRVPRRGKREADPGLLDLYRRALELWEKPDSPELAAGFLAIAEGLQADFPDAWLLRWNLLESLLKQGQHGPLAKVLRAELLEIETRYSDDAPISTGLRFLDDLY